MRFLRGVGTALWRFMIIFSFIVNFILVLVLLVAGLYIFQIKQQVADPLIGGLHSTAAGLGDATIDWTIPVRDTIPVILDIPLQQDTSVILTAPVPLSVSAVIDLPGLNAVGVPAFVNLTLPAGLALPVALDLNVPVNQDLDIALDVRAVIPLQETQLIDPITRLGLLFEPLSIALHNLPNNFGEAGDFVGQVMNGDVDNSRLLFGTSGDGFNSEPYDAWLGYSQTAGLNYDLFTVPYPEPNQAVETGINIQGGIPALDALIRPGVYDAEGNFIPIDLSAQAASDLVIPPETYDGSMAEYYAAVQAQIQGDADPFTETPAEAGQNAQDAQTAPDNNPTQPQTGQTSPEDYGIIPTPTAP